MPADLGRGAKTGQHIDEAEELRFELIVLHRPVHERPPQTFPVKPARFGRLDSVEKAMSPPLHFLFQRSLRNERVRAYHRQ